MMSDRSTALLYVKVTHICNLCASPYHCLENQKDVFEDKSSVN